MYKTYSCYFSSEFYQGGVRFLQCFSFCRGFQDYQILFASVYAPFISVAHVDLDTEDKGAHVSLC